MSSRADLRHVDSAPTASISGETRRSRAVSWSIFLALTVVGALITWFRVPSDHRDRAWAEDGTIFLFDAVERGPWTVLFHGYAGYQQFFPRVVIGAIWPFFDIVAFPVVVFAACSLLTGLAGAAVYWWSRDIVPWLPARIALAGITVLIPLATQEVLGNLADLHSYAMWIMPWLLLYRPRTRWSSAALAVLAFALVMTEIQTVFFVFLVFFVPRKLGRTTWAVYAAFLVGAVAQIATSLTDDRASGEGLLSIPSTVAGWMINTVIPLANADADTVRRWVDVAGLLPAIVILVPFVAAALACFIWGTFLQRLLAVSLLLASAAVYASSAWANSTSWFRYAEVGLGSMESLAVNSRYGVASGLLLLGVVPLAAAIIVRRWPLAPVRWGAAGTLVALTAILAHGTTTATSVRDDGDRWSPAARAAVEQCRQAMPSDRVGLPVSPFRSVEFSCADVLRLSR